MVKVLHGSSARVRFFTHARSSVFGVCCWVIVCAWLAIPQASADSNPTITVEGELQVSVKDFPHHTETEYSIQTPTGALKLRFREHAPRHLLSGSLVRARGQKQGSTLELASGSDSSSLQTLALASPNTFGAQKTLVLLVNFQDNTSQPWTVADAQSLVFNNVSSFYQENSYGQTWLIGDVAGWFMLPRGSTTCDNSNIASLADQAAASAGVNLSAYAHKIYVFPQVSACGWSGLGSVGGNPSQAWINGYFNLSVVGHELGHNLGLFHSHSEDCGVSSIVAPCVQNEYGDLFDIMGNNNAGHMNAYQKERLGWLNYGSSPAVTTVGSSGTYSVGPYEMQDGSAKALKILKSTDPSTSAKTFYYVEYRQPLGADSFLSGSYYATIPKGVVVHVATENDGSTSDLLDMTPSSSSIDFYEWADSALPVGSSFVDPGSGVSITPIAVGSPASVRIDFGSATCTHANPVVSVSPAQGPAVAAGSPVTYTVAVANADNASCATSIFHVAATVPSGWAASIASPDLTLNPGASGSTSIQVTSPAGANTGTSSLSFAVNNKSYSGYSALAVASYTVAVPQSPVVSVILSQPSYKRGQTLSATATVTANNLPLAGAAATFTMTKANGSNVTSSSTTNSAGQAVFTYRIRKNDPIGTYALKAVTSNSSGAGQSSTSFIVQ